MKRALRMLKVALGLGILGFLLASVDLGEVARIAGRGKPSDLALGVLFLLLSLPVFQAWRLHVLIEGYTRSWAVTLRLFFIGALFNNVLPSNVGGDAVRLLYLQRMSGRGWGAPLALLLLHRLSGIGVIVAIAGVYALLFGDEALRAVLGLGVRLPSGQGLVIASLLALGTLVALALMPSRLRDALAGRARSLLVECRRGLSEVGPRAMFALIVLTVLYHASRLFGFLYLVRYMGQDIAIGELLMVMAVTAVVALVPVTVGALGVMEGSITLLLGAYGVSAPAAVLVALVNRLVLLASALAGGVLYLSEPRSARAVQGDR